jgi:hypothetical protein
MVPRRVRQLEVYLRPFCWHTDRLDVALAAFWSAVCTPFSVHAYISLMTSVEALLSTSHWKITEHVAKRAAALLSRQRKEQNRICDLVKHLYDVRSRLVHGSAREVKGARKWSTTYVSAKRSNVSVGDFADLAQVSVGLICRVLDDPQLLAVIQTLRNEDETTEALKTHYSKLVATQRGR